MKWSNKPLFGTDPTCKQTKPGCIQDPATIRIKCSDPAAMCSRAWRAQWPGFDSARARPSTKELFLMIPMHMMNREIIPGRKKEGSTMSSINCDRCWQLTEALITCSQGRQTSVLEHKVLHRIQNSWGRLSNPSISTSGNGHCDPMSVCQLTVLTLWDLVVSFLTTKCLSFLWVAGKLVIAGFDISCVVCKPATESDI